MRVHLLPNGVLEIFADSDVESFALVHWWRLFKEENMKDPGRDTEYEIHIITSAMIKS